MLNNLDWLRGFQVQSDDDDTSYGTFAPAQTTPPADATSQINSDLLMPGSTPVGQQPVPEIEDPWALAADASQALGDPLLGLVDEPDPLIPMTDGWDDIPTEEPSPVSPSFQGDLSSPGTGDANVERWSDIVKEASQKYGVPEAVIKATIDLESSGNPNAVSAPTQYGHARGLMQVMDFHWKDGENPMDPRANIMKGTALLADNYKKWGAWDKAFAAYYGAIDRDGNITGASDASGVTGSGYVDMVNQRLAKYGGIGAASRPDSMTTGSSGGGRDLSQGGSLDVRASQYGDKELTKAEADAACGPAAAAAFMAMFGRKPTVAEAKVAAEAKKLWSAATGMYGPEAEVKLINALGGQAELQWERNPKRILSELQQGNTVIVDSPGHYGVISGYNPSTNEYYFGTSASDLRGGRPWMTLEEYESLPTTGQIRAALYAVDPTNNQSYVAGTSAAAPEYGPPVPQEDDEALVPLDLASMTPSTQPGKAGQDGLASSWDRLIEGAGDVASSGMDAFSKALETGTAWANKLVTGSPEEQAQAEANYSTQPMSGTEQQPDASPDGDPYALPGITGPHSQGTDQITIDENFNQIGDADGYATEAKPGQEALSGPSWWERTHEAMMKAGGVVGAALQDNPLNQTYYRGKLTPEQQLEAKRGAPAWAQEQIDRTGRMPSDADVASHWVKEFIDSAAGMQGELDEPTKQWVIENSPADLAAFVKANGRLPTITERVQRWTAHKVADDIIRSAQVGAKLRNGDVQGLAQDFSDYFRSTDMGQGVNATLATVDAVKALYDNYTRDGDEQAKEEQLKTAKEAAMQAFMGRMAEKNKDKPWYTIASEIMEQGWYSWYRGALAGGQMESAQAWLPEFAKAFADLSKQQGDMLEAHPEWAAHSYGDFEKASDYLNPAAYARAALQSLPGMATGWGAGWVTSLVTKSPTAGRAAQAATSYVAMAGDVYQDARKAGMSHDEAYRIAQASGQLQAAIEVVPFMHVPAGKANAFTRNLATNWIRESLNEGIEEVEQTVAENLYAQIYDKNRGLFEDAIQSFFAGFGASVVTPLPKGNPEDDVVLSDDELQKQFKEIEGERPAGEIVPMSGRSVSQPDIEPPVQPESAPPDITGGDLEPAAETPAPPSTADRPYEGPLDGRQPEMAPAAQVGRLEAVLSEKNPETAQSRWDFVDSTLRASDDIALDSIIARADADGATMVAAMARAEKAARAREGRPETPPAQEDAPPSITAPEDAPTGNEGLMPEGVQPEGALAPNPDLDNDPAMDVLKLLNDDQLNEVRGRAVETQNERMGLLAAREQQRRAAPEAQAPVQAPAPAATITNDIALSAPSQRIPSSSSQWDQRTGLALDEDGNALVTIVGTPEAVAEAKRTGQIQAGAGITITDGAKSSDVPAGSTYAHLLVKPDQLERNETRAHGTTTFVTSGDQPVAVQGVRRDDANAQILTMPGDRNAARRYDNSQMLAAGQGGGIDHTGEKDAVPLWRGMSYMGQVGRTKPEVVQAVGKQPYMRQFAVATEQHFAPIKRALDRLAGRRMPQSNLSGLAWMPGFKGVNQPNMFGYGKNAVAINPHEILRMTLNWATRKGIQPWSAQFKVKLANDIVVTLTHEITHDENGGHDIEFERTQDALMDTPEAQQMMSDIIKLLDALSPEQQAAWERDITNLKENTVDERPDTGTEGDAPAQSGDLRPAQGRPSERRELPDGGAGEGDASRDGGGGVAGRARGVPEPAADGERVPGAAPEQVEDDEGLLYEEIVRDIQGGTVVDPGSPLTLKALKDFYDLTNIEAARILKLLQVDGIIDDRRRVQGAEDEDPRGLEVELPADPAETHKKFGLKQNSVMGRVVNALAKAQAESPDGIAHLDGEEVKALMPAGGKTRDSITKPLSLDAIRAIGKIGMRFSDWYFDYMEQFQKLVGHGGREFAMLNAILSAQTKVQDHTEGALKVMIAARDYLEEHGEDAFQLAGTTRRINANAFISKMSKGKAAAKAKAEKAGEVWEDSKPRWIELDENVARFVEWLEQSQYDFPMQSPDKLVTAARAYFEGTISRDSKVATFGNNFFLAWLGQYDRRTTNDIWQGRIFGAPLTSNSASSGPKRDRFGNTLFTGVFGNANAYDWASALQLWVAQEMGVVPNRLQAAIWTVGSMLWPDASDVANNPDLKPIADQEYERRIKSEDGYTFEDAILDADSKGFFDLPQVDGHEILDSAKLKPLAQQLRARMIRRPDVGKSAEMAIVSDADTRMTDAVTAERNDAYREAMEPQAPRLVVPSATLDVLMDADAFDPDTQRSPLITQPHRFDVDADGTATVTLGQSNRENAMFWGAVLGRMAEADGIVVESAAFDGEEISGLWMDPQTLTERQFASLQRKLAEKGVSLTRRDDGVAVFTPAVPMDGDVFAETVTDLVGKAYPTPTPTEGGDSIARPAPTLNLPPPVKAYRSTREQLQQSDYDRVIEALWYRNVSKGRTDLLTKALGDLGERLAADPGVRRGAADPYGTPGATAAGIASALKRLDEQFGEGYDGPRDGGREYAADDAARGMAVEDDLPPSLTGAEEPAPKTKKGKKAKLVPHTLANRILGKPIGQPVSILTREQSVEDAPLKRLLSNYRGKVRKARIAGQELPPPPRELSRWAGDIVREVEQEMSAEAEAGIDSGDVKLGKPASTRLGIRNAGDVRRMIEDVGGFVPTSMVKAILKERRPYLDNVMRFMLEQREKVLQGGITARDLAKAYYMTVASQGSAWMQLDAFEEKMAALGYPISITDLGIQAADDPLLFVEVVEKTYTSGKQKGQPYLEYYVRPEEAAAAWLFSPEGERALNAIEENDFLYEMWFKGATVRLAFGDDRFYGNNVLGEKSGVDSTLKAVNLANIYDLAARINARIDQEARLAPGVVDEDRVGQILDEEIPRLSGISTGKTGFVAQLFGFANLPTLDAVALNAWMTGKGSVKLTDDSDLRDTLTAAAKEWISDKTLATWLRDQITAGYEQLRDEGYPGTEDIDPRIFQNIMHHWLWDRAKGDLSTTHKGMHESEARAMEGDDVQWDDEVSPDRFIELRNRNARGAFMSAIAPEDLADRRLFVQGSEETGWSGFALSPEGDIQNVFNVPGESGNKSKGGGAEAMLKAIAEGGVTLDCFDPFLPQYYHQFGFEETGRLGFNRDYAPEGWDYDNYGEPDVVLMAYRDRGETRDQILGRVGRGRREWLQQPHAPRFEEWDDAAASRDRFLAERGGEDAAGELRGDGRAGVRDQALEAAARSGEERGLPVGDDMPPSLLPLDDAAATMQRDSNAANEEPRAMAVESGADEIGVGFDEDFLRKEIASRYAGDLGAISVKELVQNSVDASREIDGATTDVDVDLPSRTIRVSDQGTGMTPEVVGKEFTKLGGSKKGGISSGGFGTAKVAFLGNSSMTYLRTVAKNADGEYVETVLIGSGDQYLKPDKNGGMQRRYGAVGSVATQYPDVYAKLPTNMRGDWPLDEDGNPRTGTIIQVTIRPEAKFDNTGIYVDSNGKEWPQTPEVKTWISNFLPDLRLKDQKVNFRVDGKEVAPSDWNAATNELGSFEFKGTTYRFYGSDRVSERQGIQLNLLNNGLPQNAIYIQTQQAKLPARIVLDVETRVPAGTVDYPWTVDRTNLVSDHKQALEDWIERNLVGASNAREMEIYRRALERSPQIKGAKGLRMVNTAPDDQYDSYGNDRRREAVERWAESPWAKEIAQAFEKATALVSKIAPTYSFISNIHAATTPKVWGLGTAKEWLGVNIGGGAVGQSVNVILYNPFHMIREAVEYSNAEGSTYWESTAPKAEVNATFDSNNGGWTLSLWTDKGRIEERGFQFRPTLERLKAKARDRGEFAYVDSLSTWDMPEHIVPLAVAHVKDEWDDEYNITETRNHNMIGRGDSKRAALTDAIRRNRDKLGLDFDTIRHVGGEEVEIISRHSGIVIASGKDEDNAIWNAVSQILDGSEYTDHLPLGDTITKTWDNTQGEYGGWVEVPEGYDNETVMRVDLPGEPLQGNVKKFVRKLAKIMAKTTIHEYTHEPHRAHDEGFAGTFGRLMANVEDEVVPIFEKMLTKLEKNGQLWDLYKQAETGWKDNFYHAANTFEKVGVDERGTDAGRRDDAGAADAAQAGRGLPRGDGEGVRGAGTASRADLRGSAQRRPDVAVAERDPDADLGIPRLLPGDDDPNDDGPGGGGASLDPRALETMEEAGIPVLAPPNEGPLSVDEARGMWAGEDAFEPAGEPRVDIPEAVPHVEAVRKAVVQIYNDVLDQLHQDGIEPDVPLYGQALAESLLTGQYADDGVDRKNALLGLCAAAADATRYLLERDGIKLTPMVKKRYEADGSSWTHRWLQDRQGRIVDPTADQFNTPEYSWSQQDYDDGRAAGFMSQRRDDEGRQMPSQQAEQIADIAAGIMRMGGRARRALPDLSSLPEYNAANEEPRAMATDPAEDDGFLHEVGYGYLNTAGLSPEAARIIGEHAETARQYPDGVSQSSIADDVQRRRLGLTPRQAQAKWARADSRGLAREVQAVRDGMMGALDRLTGEQMARLRANPESFSEEDELSAIDNLAAVTEASQYLLAGRRAAESIGRALNQFKYSAWAARGRRIVETLRNYTRSMDNAAITLDKLARGEEITDADIAAWELAATHLEGMAVNGWADENNEGVDALLSRVDRARDAQDAAPGPVTYGERIVNLSYAEREALARGDQETASRARKERDQLVSFITQSVAEQARARNARPATAVRMTDAMLDAVMPDDFSAMASDTGPVDPEVVKRAFLSMSRSSQERLQAHLDAAKDKNDRRRVEKLYAAGEELIESVVRGRNTPQDLESLFASLETTPLGQIAADRLRWLLQERATQYPQLPPYVLEPSERALQERAYRAARKRVERTVRDNFRAVLSAASRQLQQLETEERQQARGEERDAARAQRRALNQQKAQEARDLIERILKEGDPDGALAQQLDAALSQLPAQGIAAKLRRSLATQQRLAASRATNKQNADERRRLAAELRALAKRARTEGASEALISRARAVQGRLRSQGEKGQNQADRLNRSLVRGGLVRYLGKAKGIDDDQMEAAMKLLASVDPNNPDEVGKLMKILRHGTAWDRLIEWTYISRLSGLQTWFLTGINMTANAMATLALLGYRMPAMWAMDALTSPFRGGERNIRMADLKAAYKGVGAALLPAGKAALHTWRTGFNPDGIDRAATLGEWGGVQNEYLTAWLSGFKIGNRDLGGLGAFAHMVSTRPLQAGDVFFQTLIETAVMHELASSKARRTGVPVATILGNIVDHPDILDEMQSRSDYTLLKSKTAWTRAFATLTNAPEGDKASSDVALATRIILTLMLPFVRVPVNQAKQGFEYSAPGALYALGRQLPEAIGQYQSAKDAEGRATAERRQADILTKAMGGLALTGLAVVLYAAGAATGDGPDDPEEWQRWKLSHEPRSIWNPITREWWSYDSLPIALPFASTINAMEKATARVQKLRETGKVTSGDVALTFLEALGAGGQGYLSALANSTWAKGAAEMLQVVSERNRQPVSDVLTDIAANQITAIVPNLIGSMASVFDNYERDAKTFGEKLQKRIPGMRNQLEVSRDRLGREVENPRGGIVKGALLPFPRRGPDRSSPTTEFLDDVGLNIGKPPTTVAFEGSSLSLEPAEQRRYQRYAGEIISRTLDTYTATDKWKELQKKLQGKNAALRIEAEENFQKDVIKPARKAAKEKVLAEIFGDPARKEKALREWRARRGLEEPVDDE